MKLKFVCKMLVDVAMLILLVVLMGYPITGTSIHITIGIAELILFLLHNILNIQWYRNLFRGKYISIRIMQTVINLLTLVSMLGLFISGAILSDCFGLIDIKGMTAFARRLHMLSSYWGFAFMSLHLGMHWKMLVVMFSKIQKASKTETVLLRVIALAVAVFGAYEVVSNKLWEYMLLRTEFVFFSFNSSAIMFFAQYLAMMGMWVFISHYSSKLIMNVHMNNRID